jgi:hypothetical protein
VYKVAALFQEFWTYGIAQQTKYLSNYHEILKTYGESVLDTITLFRFPLRRLFQTFYKNQFADTKSDTEGHVLYTRHSFFCVKSARR